VVEVLVFTRTTGYRHESIPAGVVALGGVATEDPSVFTPESLRRFAAVVFLNTSGEVLTDPGRRAFEEYVRGGGGFVGVHCAAATEEDWPFYRSLVGASFAGHPDVQPATIRVVDSSHPATAHLGPEWHRTDEWYDFHAPPTGVRVLLRLDESSYSGGRMGDDHPLAWCHSVHGGRSFYTALGHTVASYSEPAVRAHLAGAVAWVTG
jgi:type 1 glutamine amidotransferase